jgi:hypothetical protein
VPRCCSERWRRQESLMLLNRQRQPAAWPGRLDGAAALGHDGALRLDAEKRAWWMRLQGPRAKDIAEALWSIDL